jgi:hypothetical protein
MSKATKSSVKRRTVNNASKHVSKKKGGAPFNELDPKRRLGTFTGAGEHARVGGRTSGIVGQTTKTNKTDKKSTNRSKSK